MNREEKIKDLQRQIDELKNEPEFQKGDWVFNTTNWFHNCHSRVFQVKDIRERDDCTFIYIEPTYTNCSGYENDFIENFRPATNEEVEAALIAEAKKRGFKEGVTVNSLSSCEGVRWNIDHPEYKHEYNQEKQTFHFHNIMVFKKGQWAEIITEPKVTINGYDMKQDEDIISFGCAIFHKEWFRCAYELLETSCQSWGNNRKLKSITLDSGVEITVEELKLICDNIK